MHIIYERGGPETQQPMQTYTAMRSSPLMTCKSGVDWLIMQCLVVEKTLLISYNKLFFFTDKEKVYYYYDVSLNPMREIHEG